MLLKGSSERELPMTTLLLLVLVLLAVGAMPAWPYSRSWGYYPSAGLGVVVLIMVLLLFSGRI
jgi:low affinity Fe/Cu permease